MIIETRISQIQTIYIGKSKKGIYHFDTEVVRTWLGIVEVDSEWFKYLWSSKQLALIEKINVEIIDNYNGNESEKIRPTEHLVELSKEFNKEKASS